MAYALIETHTEYARTLSSPIDCLLADTSYTQTYKHTHANKYAHKSKHTHTHSHTRN